MEPITPKRAIRYLAIIFAKAATSDTPIFSMGKRGMLAKIVVDDLIQNGVPEDEDTPSLAYNAARLISLDGLQRGWYRGIPSDCLTDLECLIRFNLRQLALNGAISPEAYTEAQRYVSVAAENCYRECRAHPDPTFQPDVRKYAEYNDGFHPDLMGEGPHHCRSISSLD